MVQLPVRSGGLASAAALDNAAIAKQQNSEKAKRFTLISFISMVVNLRSSVEHFGARELASGVDEATGRFVARIVRARQLVIAGGCCRPLVRCEHTIPSLSLDPVTGINRT